MILRSIGLIIAVAFTHFARAQSLDTLVLVNQKIVGRVTEVTPDLVAYKLSSEDVLHKINKAGLIKICFGNGKVEESPLLNVPLISFPKEWSKVKIVEQPEDIQGVYKIDDIIFPWNTLTEKWRNSLKMAAAMMGGNIVRVTGSVQFSSSGYSSTPIYSHGRNTGYISHSYSSMYNQTIARVYTTKLLDSIALKELLVQKPILSLLAHLKLRGSLKYRIAASEFSPYDFMFAKCSIENSNIFIHGKLPGIRPTKFHVNYFDKEKIVLSYRTRYNTKYHVLSMAFRSKDFADIKKY